MVAELRIIAELQEYTLFRNENYIISYHIIRLYDTIILKRSSYPFVKEGGSNVVNRSQIARNPLRKRYTSPQKNTQ